MRFSFANRERETRALSAFVAAPDDPASSQVCLVHGRSGVGKSRLVDQVATTATDWQFVRVTIRASDYRSGESGFFLRAAALAVADACERQEWGVSLKAFSKVRGGLAAVRAGLGAAVLEVASLPGSMRAAASWSEESAALRTLLGDSSTPASRLAASYLSHVLSLERIVVAIENAQSIDAESLQYLCQVAEDNPTLRIIYEFTPKADRAGPAETDPDYEGLLAAHTTHSRTVFEIRLGQISFEDLAKANFQALDPRFIEVLRNELSAKSGNVRALERLHDVTDPAFRVSAHEVPPSHASTTEAALVALTSESKLILWIIALSRRDLDPYELSTIVGFLPQPLRPQSPHETAKRLSPFIVERQGLFCIDHDSLLSLLEKAESNSRERLVAADALARYLQSFLTASDFSLLSQNEILFGLLWLSGPLASTALVELAVSRLERNAKTSGRPTGLLRLVHDFSHKSLRGPLHNRTMSGLVRIVYDACWIEGAIDLTERHRDSSPDIRLCHCHALALLGRSQQADQELEAFRVDVQKQVDDGSNLKRVLNFIALTGVLLARVRGDYAEAKRRYLRLNEKAFAPSEDKVLYLRFSEIAGVDGVAERLQRALLLAWPLEDKSHFVRSAIALAMVQAEGGDTSGAIALLDEAASLSDLSYVDTYNLATNRLAAETLAGMPSEKSVATLYDFLPSVVDSMDRILVLNNLLAATSLRGDAASAARFQEQLESRVDTLVEPNMRRITCYNLATYFGAQSMDALAQEYRRRAFSTAIDFDVDYWRAREAGSTDVSADFRLSRKFDLPMMSNWYFTLPDFEVKT